MEGKTHRLPTLRRPGAAHDATDTMPVPITAKYATTAELWRRGQMDAAPLFPTDDTDPDLRRQPLSLTQSLLRFHKPRLFKADETLDVLRREPHAARARRSPGRRPPATAPPAPGRATGYLTNYDPYRAQEAAPDRASAATSATTSLAGTQGARRTSLVKPLSHELPSFGTARRKRRSTGTLTGVRHRETLHVAPLPGRVRNLQGQDVDMPRKPEEVIARTPGERTLALAPPPNSATAATAHPITHKTPGGDGNVAAARPSTGPATSPQDASMQAELQRWPYANIQSWGSELTAKVVRELRSQSDFVRERAATLVVGTCHDARCAANLPDKVTEALKVALVDSNFKVRLAAGLTLTCHSGFNDAVAVDVLNDAMATGTQLMRWRAASCMAAGGISNELVIKALIDEAVPDDSMHRAEARQYLVVLSATDGLVTALVADLLNSDIAAARLTAIELLPQLQGLLSEDVAQKLAIVMWDDWDAEVRTRACATLSRSHHGNLVHEGIIMRLDSSAERIRASAVMKIGELGHVTRRLLSRFLRALNDRYISVRVKACEAAGLLRNPSPDIISGLFDCLAKDGSAKVRLASLKALHTLKVRTAVFDGLILWVLSHERDTFLVLEALSLLRDYKATNQTDFKTAVLNLAKDPDKLIRRAAIETKEALGWEHEDQTRDEHLLHIDRTLDELGSKEKVIDSVFNTWQTTRVNLERLLHDGVPKEHQRHRLAPYRR